MPRPNLLVCLDCAVLLSDEERDHYIYQCHTCVLLEHDLTGLAARDPEHPEAARMTRIAVEPHSPSSRLKIDLPRRLA